jgi:hypothetical protein
MCESIAQFMDYHAHKKSGDGVLRMPSDGYAFREIEEKWENFKDESRNVMISLHLTMLINLERLGLFTQCGLFFYINNNIPPWMSIKREHIMSTMIFPGICLQ